MASIIAKYVFDSNAIAEAAFDKIRYEVSGGSSRYGNEIEIYDDCRDPSKVASICLAHGGRPK